MKIMKRFLAITAIGAALAAIASPSRATPLVDEGITYTLQILSGANTTTANFNLHIAGINGLTDLEKGRYGVESFAFNPPDHFLSASGPAGYIFQSGGLNSGGCNGHGNFFCFNGPDPTHVVLAANSVLDLAFTVTLSSGNFLNYTPDFKINWVGTKRNYDLVSAEIIPEMVETRSVPGPLVGAGLPGLVAGSFALLALVRRRRQGIEA